MLIWQMSASNFFGDHIRLSEYCSWILLAVATFGSPNYLCWELEGGFNGCLQSLSVDWILAPLFSQLHRFWALMLFLYFWHFSLMVLISRQVWLLSLCVAFLINDILPLCMAARPSSYCLQLTSVFCPSAFSAYCCQNLNLAFTRTYTSFLHWSLAKVPNICFIKW